MSRHRPILLLLLAAALGVSAVSQTRRPAKRTPRPAPSPTPGVVSAPAPTPEPVVQQPLKRNGRPDKEVPAEVQAAVAPTHIYKFSRPGFLYPTIEIAHDDAGLGTITFTKDGDDQPMTDPIVLTSATLKKLEGAFAELGFLDSKESYQFPGRDFSNLGNVEITLRRGGRERTARYNWTENKAAKLLMDEYRRISNEFIWKFEVEVARENQPLETPKLMEALDAYEKRGELSDPQHLTPYLTEIANDERLPLIARNHAKRLIETIQKRAAKEK